MDPHRRRNRSSRFQLREHLACGGVALVGKAPQFLEVALLASELDELVACGGVALVGKAPQFLEVALLASELDELVACGGVALVGKAPQFLEVALLASELALCPRQRRSSSKLPCSPASSMS